MKKTPLLAVLVALTSALAVGKTGPTAAVRPLTLDFAGTPSRAELRLPANATQAPLVLLIQGTGLEDMNGHFVFFGGQVPGSLGALAEHLTGQGFAVMRFDKRYAALSFQPGQMQAAQAKYAPLTMSDLLSDARTALNTARTQPGVDGSRVFIYGWSEGSVIAANLALEVKAAGLIVQGPVVNSYAQTFARQFERVGIPYLTPYAQGGQLDLMGLMNSFAGPGSLLAKMQGQLLFALDSTPQNPKLNAFMDTNQDGRLDLKAEALPAIQALYPQLTAQNPKYAPATTLPTLGELAPKLHLPTLILQGQNDGNIDPADAQQLLKALNAAGNTQTTLKLYPGLGHTLGKAVSITQDDFAPMTEQPINDLSAWLKAQHRD